MVKVSKDLDLALKATELALQGKYDMGISLLVCAGFGKGWVCGAIREGKRNVK